MNASCAIARGPQYLDIASIVNETPSLQARIIAGATEVKQLYDRNKSLLTEILQLRSEHILNGQIKVPYIPRNMYTASIARIPPQYEIDQNNNKILIKPSMMVEYGPNEEIPFRNITAYDGFEQMGEDVFKDYCTKLMAAKTRAEVRAVIDAINVCNPGASLEQIQTMAGLLRGSFGHDARIYLVCSCGIRPVACAMGSIRPDLTNPSSGKDIQEHAEAVFTLIDSLPSMEERDLAFQALCGPATEAGAIIKEAQSRLMLGMEESDEEDKMADVELNIAADEHEEKEEKQEEEREECHQEEADVFAINVAEDEALE